jgi:hypothetical protein
MADSDNKTGNVHIKENRGAFAKILLPQKTIDVTYSECVFVALGIEHAARMHRTTLSFVACLTVTYFFTLSHKGMIFGVGWGVVIEHEMYFDFLYKFCPEYFSF